MSSERKREISAGGVVVRGDQTVVIVPRKPGPEGQRTLALPKGHPDDGESMEQAATREVREETGVDAELIEPLGDVDYWYRRKDGRPRPKRVTFYLFEYRSGDVADHDHEVEEALWMPLEEARTALTFPREREIVERALERRGG
ncbi:MAG TPA: NUDIX hydrolase [Solirubrobacteraceae bacterium]|jgi:8-oxo-dGTP pyrophosphatase MutT (NUDIX family)|nr:NUDIX hydrolase [Solirubrobacteraceae bacterium]